MLGWGKGAGNKGILICTVSLELGHLTSELSNPHLFPTLPLLRGGDLQRIGTLCAWNVIFLLPVGTGTLS